MKLGGLDREVLLLVVIDLAEQNRPAPALAFYQQTAAAGRPKPKGAEVLLGMDAGQIYFIEEKPKEGAECFAAVLRALDQPGESGLDDEMKKDILGEPGLTYQMMGECFLAAGRLDEARTAFQKAETAAPNKALRQFNLARLDAKAGKPAEALKELEAALAGHLADRGTAPYETLADVLAKLGKKNDLTGRLEKLRATNPKDLPLGYFLAQQYREAGKPDKAESLYRELIRAPPRPTASPMRPAITSWQTCIAAASGSTPCWASWARAWRRSACWRRRTMKSSRWPRSRRWSASFSRPDAGKR